MSAPLLKVEDLTVQYRTDQNWLTAVSNASFTVKEGEYFGLVGESGCGKSTLVKSLIGALDDNGRIESGTIEYRGEEIQNYGDKELNDRIRWTDIALIPQGSMNSLDPLQRISEQAQELCNVHTDMTHEESDTRLRELLEVVGLPASRADDYPHQFSGGMQQRVIIAFSLLLEPSLIIADEPTTALDVIMQDQIFKYFSKIRGDQDASMVLITHDISVVFESCDRMAVMHSGQIAETGTVEQVFDEPHHPYSYQLQHAFPDIRYPDRELEIIQGVPPQTYGEIDYCSFADRCPWAIEKCTAEAPPLESTSDNDPRHRAACVRKHEMPELADSDVSDLDSGTTETEVNSDD